ncbi:hypothetical protein GGR58DRAFT_132568 [Xylaria digitata]|nr:hypothetical protein GGR58DRAFT_132568 [Xylaria digitata]
MPWRCCPEKRASNEVHILLGEVVGFLSNREFLFADASLLLGLPGSDTQGVRNGDDMLFIARCDPGRVQASVLIVHYCLTLRMSSSDSSRASVVIAPYIRINAALTYRRRLSTSGLTFRHSPGCLQSEWTGDEGTLSQGLKT